MSAGGERQFEAVIVEQAGEWYARHRDGKLTAAETEAFMAWLQNSPLHIREYLATAELAAHLPAAAKGLQVDRHELVERARAWLRTSDNVVALRSMRATAPAPRGFMRRSRLLAAFAAVLVLGVAGGLYWEFGTPGLSGWPRVLEVPRGEQRTVRLRDGSVLHLNADTRVRVRYSPAQRLIDLEHGQALFSVARNTARPFVVRAGETDVVAVGTQFDVLRRGAEGPVTVTVVEGKVDVLSHEAQRRNGKAPTTSIAGKPVRLIAGQQVRLTAIGTVSRPQPVDVRAATAWLRRELVFNEQRLAEVAEEFSRYGTSIEIEDPALREYRVSGVFNAYDVESFVTYLKRIGTVEPDGAGIRVRSR